MAHDFLIRRTAIFQHILDQIDAPTRTVEFVAKRHIGRACGGTESAMHAFAQDFSASLTPGSRNCSGLKWVCMVSSSGLTGMHTPRIEDIFWIELMLQPLRKCGKCGRLRFKHFNA